MRSLKFAAKIRCRYQGSFIKEILSARQVYSEVADHMETNYSLKFVSNNQTIVYSQKLDK